MSLIEKFGFGPAARAQRDAARFNLKLKKKNKKKRKAPSLKLQASSAIKGTHSKGKILKIERKT